MATVDVRAAAVAVRGIATDDQLVDVGISRRTIRRRVASGVWIRVAPGVVRLWPTEDDQLSVRVAVLAGPGGTLASHVSAAVLHDIGGFSHPTRPHVLVPRGHRYLALDVATVHTTARNPGPGIVVDGIPTTTVARTLRDLAALADVPRRMVHRAVRDALRDGLVSLDDLTAEAEPRGRGRRRLREATQLELRTVGQRTESRLERAWADAFLEGGITGFVTQYEVCDHGRTVRLDIAWPELRIAVEVDGARFHGDALAIAADAERTAWLEARGWKVIRVTAEDLRGERRRLVLAEVRNTLATSCDPATDGRIT